MEGTSNCGYHVPGRGGLAVAAYALPYCRLQGPSEFLPEQEGKPNTTRGRGGGTVVGAEAGPSNSLTELRRLFQSVEGELVAACNKDPRSTLVPLTVDGGSSSPIRRRTSVQFEQAAAAVATLCTWMASSWEGGGREVATSAAAVLSRLLSFQPLASVAVNNGVLTTILALLNAEKHCCSPDLVKWCLGMLEGVVASTVANDVTDKKIYHMHLTAALVQVMVGHALPWDDDSASVVLGAAEVLATLVKRTRHRNALLKAEGIPRALLPLLGASHSPSNLVKVVCDTLVTFCRTSEDRLLLLVSGGVPNVVAAFQRLSPQMDMTIDIHALTSVVRLVCELCNVPLDSTEIRPVLDDLASFGPPLTALLQASSALLAAADPTIVELWEVSLAALRHHIGITGESSRIVPLCISAIETLDYRQPAVKEAIGTLTVAVVDPENREILGHILIPLVLGLLERCDSLEQRKLVKLSLCCLINLSNHADNQKLMSEHNAPFIVLDCLNRFQENVQIVESALSVLDHIASHDGCYEAIVECGGIEIIESHLADNLTDATIVIRGCSLLTRLIRQLRAAERRRSEAKPNISDSPPSSLETFNRIAAPTYPLVTAALEGLLFDERVAVTCANLLLLLLRTSAMMEGDPGRSLVLGCPSIVETLSSCRELHLSGSEDVFLTLLREITPQLPSSFAQHVVPS